ncbi:MAG: cation-translocating P-type ATPase [Chlamydiia bacterium]|nr:cation-translocating P-type ATPase [Chlamydiia bacterium]
MNCELCGLQSDKHIVEQDRNFCCAGCRTVWHLLSARGGLETWESHPVFKQALASGLISNPNLKAQIKTADEVKRVVFEVREMWCPSCAEVIEMLLPRQKGILTTKVDYATDLASVEYDPKKISQETLFSFIHSLGYQPVLLEDVLNKKGDKALSTRFYIAAFCSLNVMMFSYPIYASYFDFEPEGVSVWLAWLSFLFSIPVLAYSMTPIFRRFWTGMKTALWGMETLVVLGVSASFLLSTSNLLKGSTEVYFDTLTVIVAFVLWGKLIESKAKMTSKEAFYELARSLPQRVRKNGVFISVKAVEKGDLIECVAGERIPLDGQIALGEAWVNESAITGESVPVNKQTGDLVEAGGILETGRLEIKVDGKESVLNRMIEACKVNLEHKAQYIRVLDPIVRAFVPVVLVLALAVYFFSGSVSRTLAVLLISCPCAIGIAAPLVEFYMIRRIAKAGAILRNRAALFKLPEIDVWAFDKTGTLTEGNLIVRGLDRLSQEELKVLKGIALLSLHPLSRAISEVIQGEGAIFTSVFETQGEGIKASLNQSPVYLGSEAFLEANGVKGLKTFDTSQECWFFNGGKSHRLTFQDKVKPEAKDVLSQFKTTWLLSGDKKEIAEGLAKTLGISKVYAPLKPLEKQAVIKSSNLKLAFVGDGLNDAPAIAQADVGIAVHSSLGLAQAASDIILTTPSLDVLIQLRDIAKKGRRRIRQNLFWAFFYNVIGMGLAAFGFLGPIFATFAMLTSSLMVMANARR